MDRDFAVYASAGGLVIALHDGEPDRNASRAMSRGGYGNHVKIEHANGFTTLYGYLKNGSISVNVGQHVGVGEKIGVIGSSGCSDGSHLYFELRFRNETVIDPFVTGYWIRPPMYDPSFSIMDYSVQSGTIDDIGELRTPPSNNVVSIYSGDWICVGLFLSGLQVNEEIAFHWQVGNRQCLRNLSFYEVENLMIAYANLDFSEAGLATISISIGGRPAIKHEVVVKCR